MPTNVDAIIDLIDGGKVEDALDVLAVNTHLANHTSTREGVLGGASLLHWAAHRDAISLCERLLELGADINASTARWWSTPLAWGADAGRFASVELLLKHGADVNQDAFGGTTALHAVAQGGSTSGARDPEGYRKTAELLIAHGADINRRAIGDSGQTPLDDALRKHNDIVANVLRHHNAKTAQEMD